MLITVKEIVAIIAHVAIWYGIGWCILYHGSAWWWVFGAVMASGFINAAAKPKEPKLPKWLRP